MSKQYNIRWKQSDNEQLSKTVKNFNAKIRRLEKKADKIIATSKDYELVKQARQIKKALPETTSVKQMKELIDTRQDLKRELNALQRFSKRGAESIVDVPGNKYNLQTTKWQKEEMTRRIGFINRKRKKRLEQILNMDVTLRGKKVGYKKGDIGMGTVDEVALSPMNAFTPTMGRSDLNIRFKAIRRESQSSYWHQKEMLLKQNVIKGLLANYNADEFKEDVKQILDALDDMSFEEFYKRFMGESGVMEIVSPPPGSDMNDILRENLEALKSVWVPNYKKEE